MENNVVVVGGSNLDICAKSLMDIVQKDSNIGTVKFSVGGVGRNIAEFMALLGNNTSLLTAISDNGFGRVIEDNASQQGITMLCDPFEKEGYQTGVYVYFVNTEGDLVLGVNEMTITDLITPEVIKEHINSLFFTEDIIIEANLSQDTIEYICSHDFKIIADCVSSVKCTRLKNVMNRLYLLKANKAEAEVLTGKTDLEAQIRTFAEMGLQRGLITLGADGACCFENNRGKITYWKVPNPEGSVIVDTSGCGDAFLSGFVTSLMRGKSMAYSLSSAQAAAAINARSLSAVNREEFSYLSVKELAAQIREDQIIEEKTL